MISASLVSILLLVACVFVHYEMLSVLKGYLGRMAIIPRRAKLLFVIFGAMLSHFLQITLFAAHTSTALPK